MARKKSAVPTPEEQERTRALVVEKWQRERDLQAEKFLDGDGWPEIYSTWKRRMEDFAAPLDPLFQDVPILDTTGHHVGENYPHWWRPDAFERKKGEILNQLKLGRVIDPFVGGHYDNHHTKSIWQTVRHLWNAREELEIVAAIMIAGSIFLRTGGRRAGRLPEDWPDHNSLDAVNRLANARWDGNEHRDGWMHVMSDPFPANHNADNHYGVKSLRGLIEYFAVEHAASLLSFRLVNIRFISREKPVMQVV
jgi:hypothetical protein